MKIFCWRLGMLVVLTLLLTGCGDERSEEQRAMDAKVRFEVVSLESRTSNRVRVTYKATNTASKPIVRAKAKITVLDASGADIGSETHWVIGTHGNLAPSESVEDDFLITVSDPEKAASAKFTLETVRGG